MPRSAKIVQLRTKTAQNRAQEPPTRHPKTQKYSKNDLGLFVFYTSTIFAKITRKMPKKIRTWSQKLVKLEIWSHLGSNLAPSWANLAHFFVSRSWPSTAKTASKRFCIPRSPPRAPRHSIFQVSGSISYDCLVHFWSLFLQVRFFISKLFRAFLKQFPSGSLARRAPMEGDGGTHRRWNIWSRMLP